jgi:chromosome segregation ATPase
MPWLETPTSGRSSFNPASSASETDSDDDQILALRAELSSLNAVLDSNLAKIEDIGSERLDYFERLAAAEEELVLLKEKLKEGKREVERLGRVEAELAEADGREREMEKELKELWVSSSHRLCSSLCFR